MDLFSHRTMLVVIFSFVLTCFVGMPAAAALPAESGLYFGGGWGISQIDDKQAEQEVTQSLQNLGFTVNSLDISDEDNGLRLFVGYRLFSWFSLEGGFVDLGQVDIDATLSGVPVDGNVEVDGFNAAGVLHVPVYSGVSVFGKGGVYFWDSESEVGSAIIEDDVTEPTFGGGLSFSLDKTWETRFEWERFQDVAGADVDYLSASFVYHPPSY